MDNALEPVLAERDDPWRCVYCGESYQFQTHPSCLAGALSERDEARAVARVAFLFWSSYYDYLDAADQAVIDAMLSGSPWLVGLPGETGGESDARD